MLVHDSHPVTDRLAKTISVMFSLVPEMLARVQERAVLAGHLVCVFPRKEMGWDPVAERAFRGRVRCHPALAEGPCPASGT